jgi:hypothetical protein
MSDFATQAGHWYLPDGQPCYEILAKNGILRPTTLRDARKLLLRPSVTKIIKEAAAPGLERWKRQQLLMAALTLPRIEGESLEDFSKRVETDSEAQGKEARERGTQIHGEIEIALRGGPVSDYAAPVLDWLGATFGPQPWSPERSFSSSLGFGGKLDACAPGIVIDFKTKDFEASDTIKGYDEQQMQLAAYGIGLNEDLDGLIALNLFISTQQPGLICPIYWNKDQLHTGWRMFDCLLSYWMLRNDYACGAK